MKTTRRLTGTGLVWLLASIPFVCLGQYKQREVQAKLAIVASQLQEGVYERTINLGYVPSPKTYRNEELMAHNELTMVVMRFWGFEAVNDKTAYVGRVFMGERYLEKDYNRRYRSRAAYQTDNDGFFYACKLYFDERTLEYRLNVYPDHLLNICRSSTRFMGIKTGSPFTGMHFNKTECTSTRQHWESLKYVVALPDQHYDAYTAMSDTASTRRFFSRPANSPVNIQWSYLSKTNPKNREDSVDVEPTIRQTYPLREINIRKHIKCFSLGFLNDSTSQIGRALNLKFTKYGLSEDMLEGNEYTYQRILLNSLRDTALAERGQAGRLVSRNPLYRSLIVTPVPDDKFVPGFDVNGNLCIYYWDGSLTLPASPSESKAVADLTQQNNQLATAQKNYVPRSGSCPPNDLFVTINSENTDEVHWLFAGRYKTAEKPRTLARDSLFTMTTTEYLRDREPVLDAKTGLWLKGPIKFKLGFPKYVAQPGQTWRIRAVKPYTVDGFDYVWIVATVENPPKNKVRK